MFQPLMPYRRDPGRYVPGESRSQSRGNGVHYRGGPVPMQHRLNLRLEILSEILYKKVISRYSAAFRSLKLVLDNNYQQEVFERKMFRCIDRLFTILKYSNLRMKNACFQSIKNHNEGRLLFERINSVVARIGLRTIATSSRIQRFRRALLNSSKKAKIKNDGFKARHLMAVCENILSKKSVPQQLYKSFREWHLQSVLNKLSLLNEDQREMVWQQKLIVTRLLRNTVTKMLKKVFWQIKTHNVGINFVHKRLSYHLRLNYLVEKISAPFIKSVLLNFPHANWNSSKADALSLLGMCFAFKKLMTRRNTEVKVPHDKQRGCIILTKILKGRILDSKKTFFNSLTFEYKQASSTKVADDLSSRLTSTNIPQTPLQTSIYSARGPSKTLQISEGLIALDTAIFRHILYLKRSCFHDLIDHQRRFKQRQALERIQRSKANKTRLKLLRLVNKLSELMNNTLHEGFQSILDFSLDKEEDDKQSTETKILLDIVKNQAIINKKLESKHKQKAEKGSLELKQQRKKMMAVKLMYKLYQKKQHERLVLRKTFAKWQDRASFEDAKIAEYDNFIRILRSEIDVIDLDIHEIEQARLEGVEKYLNHLENVNSDLEEVSRRIMDNHQIDLRNQVVKEILQESEYVRKRNFSI